MRKIFSFFLCIHAFIHVVYGVIPTDSNKFNSAQSKFNINISAGPSIPLENFGTAQLVFQNSSTINGGAKVGFHYDISADWYFTRFIGATAMYGASINSFNTSAYNNSLNYRVPTTTTANNFNLPEYLFGVCFRNHITSKIAMHLKILVGDIEANYPNITTSFPATQSQAAGTNLFVVQSWDEFVWCFNGGISYQLPNHFSFLVDLSYSETKVRYPYSSLSQTLQGGPELSITTQGPFYMSLGLFKPTVGIAFSF